MPMIEGGCRITVRKCDMFKYAISYEERVVQ